ncbi:helix-turn-helix transcriptional regulator [Marivirga harenae]|uniref:helix-turn-helix domain-containing protein n=1 Tax=Marivirga harenae TaxID=2010992 RepID=UPI0026E0F0E8|nr:helix-turn-helix transcriptional regulator [Marivirga harenae]WKV13560.1 helix-turn-helix transcriptional regulator [Marivirga harenae]|tara:strand:- start:200537 stop:201073 length:537 start_codon:yes stop_codon:yes gene_type:complete
MTKIANNIKYLRTQKGLSQTAMAEAVGLKRGNIASYEKELAQPSIENLVKIADFFGIDIHQIVNEDLQFSPKKIPSEKSPFKIFEERFPIQGLKDRVNALKGNHNPDEKIKKLKDQNKDIHKVVEGFRAFHKMRVESSTDAEELNKKLSGDYENLLDILLTVLRSNTDLIKILDKNHE